MPTYEYRCPSCKHDFELVQRISAEPKAICPACGKDATRRLSGGAGLLFKGSGFYITDYRSDSYKKAAGADSGSGNAAGTEGGSGKAAGAEGGSGKTGGESKPSTDSPATKSTGTKDA